MRVEDVSLADAPSQVLCSTELSISENASTAVPVELHLPRSLPKKSDLAITARLLLHKDNDLQRGDFVTMVNYPLPECGSNLDLYLHHI